MTSVSNNWTLPDQPGYTGLSTPQYEYLRHTFSPQRSGSTNPLQQEHRQVSSATSHLAPPKRPHNAHLSPPPRPSDNEDGSWAPYGADCFHDKPTTAAELPHPSHRVDAIQVFPPSPSSPHVTSGRHEEPQYVESQVESSLGYFSVLTDYNDCAGHNGRQLHEVDAPAEGTTITADMTFAATTVLLPKDVEEEFLLLMATARSLVIRGERISRIQIEVHHAHMKETEARHAISMSAVPHAFAAYLQLTQHMESASRKQIRQSAQCECELITELSSEPLQRRQLETECHSERRKGITQVLQCPTRTVSTRGSANKYRRDKKVLTGSNIWDIIWTRFTTRMSPFRFSCGTTEFYGPQPPSITLVQFLSPLRHHQSTTLRLKGRPSGSRSRPTSCNQGLLRLSVHHREPPLLRHMRTRSNSEQLDGL